MTQEQMAKRTGKDRTSVANFIRLLRLPPSVQTWVESGELSFGHARALLALSPDKVESAAEIVRSRALSVRQTEDFIKDLLGLDVDKKPKKVIEPLDPNVREARDLLQRALGLRVKILDRKGKGRVVIEYSSVDDFERIVELAENSRG
jgi:ParB family chromosome partitioning protein